MRVLFLASRLLQVVGCRSISRHFLTYQPAIRFETWHIFFLFLKREKNANSCILEKGKKRNECEGMSGAPPSETVCPEDLVLSVHAECTCLFYPFFLMAEQTSPETKMIKLKVNACFNTSSLCHRGKAASSGNQP